jgi:hydroxyacylglutathione hydrolase
MVKCKLASLKWRDCEDRGCMMIFRALVLGPFGSNCYIVGSESTKAGMIIDPGGEPEVILKNVEDLGLDIKIIVLTHGHIDHVGALKAIKEATGAEVAIHTDDAQSLQNPSLGARFGLSYPLPPPPERLLSDGDSIEVGDLHFSVIHMPGHTPGGISLLGEGVVFTGDTLFNYGIGRYDLPGSSGSQLMNSIHTKLMVLPDDTIVYPGHGPETTIGNERRGNPFLLD